MTPQTPTPLHELPTWVDLTAMAVAALFGAHIARSRKVTIFGVLLAGVVAGLAGGVARDVLLGIEPAAIANWYYVPTVLAAAILGGVTARRVSLSPLPYVAAQAIALALLISIGVQKAVAYHTSGPPAILIGVVAAITGGIIDDLLTSRPVTVMSGGPWLLGVIICGAALFWLLTIYVAFYPAVVVTVASVASVRVLSVHLGWTRWFFPGDKPADTRPEPGSNSTDAT